MSDTEREKCEHCGKSRDDVDSSGWCPSRSDWESHKFVSPEHAPDHGFAPQCDEVRRCIHVSGHPDSCSFLGALDSPPVQQPSETWPVTGEPEWHGEDCPRFDQKEAGDSACDCGFAPPVLAETPERDPTTLVEKIKAIEEEYGVVVTEIRASDPHATAKTDCCSNPTRQDLRNSIVGQPVRCTNCNGSYSLAPQAEGDNDDG